MSNTNSWMTRLLILGIVFALCGVPQFVQAQQAAHPPRQTPQNTPQAQPSQQPQQGIINPAQGPLEPVPPAQELPAAPSSNQNAQPQQQQQANTPAASPQPAQQPLGAAVGQAGAAAGVPASEPAGTAIAPAKQRQVRSLLIKLGAVAAAGAAIGIVYALSKSSPSTPPGVR